MNNTENEIKLDVRTYPIAEPKSNVVGFACVTIEDVFVVNNIRVVNSEKGLFVAMPQVKDNEGKYPKFSSMCASTRFPVTSYT